MVLFNYSTKELTAKVVYYGPGLCGKTTNLQWIHEKLPIKNKGKMLSLATETDRTLFFDFLPIELGTIRGMKTRIQLYTVPGQVFYNATRRMVLKGADCVVFVCDSQEAMLEANLESFENLRQNLEANEIDANEVPMVLQYNKRDLPNALPLEILNEKLNPRNVPFYEAVAVKGTGVEETLKGVTGLVFRSLATKYGGAEAAAPATGAAPPAPAPRPVAAAPPPPAKPASVTLPPLNIDPAEASEELLESLELQPSAEGEGEELSLDAPPPIGADTDPALGAEEIEALPFEEEPGEELSFDTPSPSPADPKDTLVRGEQEADDLRRRIGRPSLPDLSLEEIAEEEEEVEEIPIEPPAPPPARVRPSPTPPPAARPAAASTRFAPQPFDPEPESETEPEPVSTVNAAPVAVQLQNASGQTDVNIPLEVTLQNGSAQVAIHLHVSLKLKLQD